LRGRFLCTGVGSLPHESADAAIDLIDETFPELPHWPQLPRRSELEGLTRQYVTPLMEAGLLVESAGRLAFVDGSAGWEERLAGYYEVCLACEEGVGDLEAFALPREAAVGFYRFLERKAGAKMEYVKGQVTGPLTLGLELVDSRGRSAFYDDTLRDLILRTVRLSALWQAEQLAALAHKVVLFLDEPGLYAHGSSLFITLDGPTIRAGLDSVYSFLEARGVITGTHVCAGTDWSILLRSEVGVVNFDAHGHFASLLPYAEELAAFLERGGILAWGIVPTSGEAELDDLVELWKESVSRLAARGVDRAALEGQCMFTPSCGTGSGTLPEARVVYELTARLAERLRRECG